MELAPIGPHKSLEIYINLCDSSSPWIPWLPQGPIGSRSRVFKGYHGTRGPVTVTADTLACVSRVLVCPYHNTMGSRSRVFNKCQGARGLVTVTADTLVCVS